MLYCYLVYDMRMNEPERMNVRLIAMDLDGTLNNDQKTIDARTRAALMAAQRRGIRLALASARPMPGLYRERDALELSAHGGPSPTRPPARRSPPPPWPWRTPGGCCARWRRCP